MSSRSRRARKVIWLTPESLQAAERLSSLTGMPVSDLIELVLLELTEYELPVAPRPRPGRPAPPEPEPEPEPVPATVIPIERARSARLPPVAPIHPRSPGEMLTDLHRRSTGEMLADLHQRCTEARALAERARLASERARARARALLEGRETDD